MCLRFIVVLLTVCSLAACVAPPNAEEQKRLKAWNSVRGVTDKTAVGEERLNLRVEAPFARNRGTLEKSLLLRASGEAMQAGYPRFAIVYLDYSETGPASWFTPDFEEASTRWIGSYEDLLAARDRSDFDGSLNGSFGFKAVDAVVLLLGEDDQPRREAFDSEAIYNTLVDDRIDRHRITATPKLKLPKLPRLIPSKR